MLRAFVAAAPMRARMMSVSAAAVKALAAEQKALLAAVDALGPSASYDSITKLIASDSALSATMEKVKADDLSWTWSMLESAPAQEPVTVAVVGAGSSVGAASLFRIAAGEMLGLATPVTLQLTGADPALLKELEGCGFPLLNKVTAAASPAAALKGATYAVLLDGDMKAAGGAVAPGTLVGVMGNANALTVDKAAGGKASITSITRGAQLAAETTLAKAAGVDGADVKNVIAWGNGVTDISHAIVNGKWALKEGGEALAATAPTDAIAADGVVAHMKDWITGSDGKLVSMGVPAVGDYGMGEGFFFSVPVVCTPGEYKRVGGVSITPAVATAMEADRVALSSA